MRWDNITIEKHLLYVKNSFFFLISTVWKALFAFHNASSIVSRKAEKNKQITMKNENKS